MNTVRSLLCNMFRFKSYFQMKSMKTFSWLKFTIILQLMIKQQFIMFHYYVKLFKFWTMNDKKDTQRDIP